MRRIVFIIILGVVALLADPVSARDATPSASPAAAPPTGHLSELASVAFGAMPAGNLSLVRAVLDPGAPEGRVVSGPIVFWVESGTIVVRLQGSAEIRHADASSESVKAGEVVLEAGDSIAIPAITMFALPRNESTSPAVVFSAAISQE